MSNHYHIVVRIRPEQDRNWSNDEVIRRWAALFGVPSLLGKLRNGECDHAEHSLAMALLEVRRERLGSLSWFMKCLNEHIARRANQEDQCTGAFWEGRFKSQALLDERALLSCMAYVDLNPIRAAMARTPQQSDYTSIQARMRRQQSVRLAPFCDEVVAQHADEAIPFGYEDYLCLVQWTGQAQTTKKNQALETQAPAILGQLGIDRAVWFKSLNLYRKPFLVIGSPDRIREAAKQLSRTWFRGLGEMAFLAKG